MCGYIGNSTDSPLVRLLMHYLGLEDALPKLHHNPGSGPASLIDVILEDDEGRRIQQAIWWLLLEKSPQGFKPSRYTSFNSRHDKLDNPRSAGFKPYRQSRCIVPASYIIEGDGAKGQRRHHYIEPTEHAFALGGLYRQWLDKETGETLHSCSIITLAPHPDQRWQNMHAKSMPLMLPADDKTLINDWLSPNNTDVRQFAHLMQPKLANTVRCTAIERPSRQNAIGTPFQIEKDESLSPALSNATREAKLD